MTCKQKGPIILRVAHIHTHIYIYIYIYQSIYNAYIYIYIHLHIYIYIETSPDSITQMLPGSKLKAQEPLVRIFHAWLTGFRGIGVYGFRVYGFRALVHVRAPSIL